MKKRATIGISLIAAFAAGRVHLPPEEAKRFDGVFVRSVTHSFLGDGGCSSTAYHENMKPVRDARDVMPREHWLLSPDECAVEKYRAAVATSLDYDAGVL